MQRTLSPFLFLISLLIITENFPLKQTPLFPFYNNTPTRKMFSPACWPKSQIVAFPERMPIPLELMLMPEKGYPRVLSLDFQITP